MYIACYRMRTYAAISDGALYHSYIKHRHTRIIYFFYFLDYDKAT